MNVGMTLTRGQAQNIRNVLAKAVADTAVGRDAALAAAAFQDALDADAATGATMTLSLACKKCGNEWTMTDDRAWWDGGWHGTFGSDADFCPACDTVVPDEACVTTVELR